MPAKVKESKKGDVGDGAFAFSLYENLKRFLFPHGIAVFKLTGSPLLLCRDLAFLQGRAPGPHLPHPPYPLPPAFLLFIYSNPKTFTHRVHPSWIALYPSLCLIESNLSAEYPVSLTKPSSPTDPTCPHPCVYRLCIRITWRAFYLLFVCLCFSFCSLLLTEPTLA